jgi:hypothetical protein
LLRERVPSIDGIYLTGEQVYAGVKNRIVDEEETNWYADAEDV